MVFVIAEAGVNHNGDLATATDLVDAAKVAGADAVKFQTFDAEVLDPPGAWRDMIAGLALPRSAFVALKAHADDVGIQFMSTPFDPDSLAFLADLGVKTMKIASGNLDNWLLLEDAGEWRDSASDRRVILSTGMAALPEIADALGCLGSANVTLLHCTSAYPCPIEDVNLKAMATMRANFGLEVGLSDHTPYISVPGFAAAAGAVVIEKHFTLDRRTTGPDHAFSLDPPDLSLMVSGVRLAARALGDGVKAPRPSEAPVMAIAAKRRDWRQRCAAP